MLACSQVLRVMMLAQETRQRAAALAQQIGADHLDVNIDAVVAAMAHLFATITGHVPRFRVGHTIPSTSVMDLIRTSFSKAQQQSQTNVLTSDANRRSSASFKHLL